MKTEVIEQEWATAEAGGWVDTTVLTAIRRPQWTYTHPDKPEESQGISPEPFEIGDRGNTFTVHSADEARQYIALLEKVVEKFEGEAK